MTDDERRTELRELFLTPSVALGADTALVWHLAQKLEWSDSQRERAREIVERLTERVEA